MTAQIAILNKVAIALASDSAVTMKLGRENKIFTSANKLFSLSRTHPVGIMVYGNADILGIPWETVIKMYRKILGDTTFATLKEYAKNFLDFLAGNTVFSESTQKEYLMMSVYGFLKYIEEEVEGKVHDLIDERGAITKSQISELPPSRAGRHLGVTGVTEHC